MHGVRRIRVCEVRGMDVHSLRGSFVSSIMTTRPTSPLIIFDPAPSFLQSLRLHVLGLGHLSLSLARMAAAAAAAADVEELHEWHVEKAGAHPCFAPVPREEAVRAICAHGQPLVDTLSSRHALWLSCVLALQYTETRYGTPCGPRTLL